MLLGIEYFYGSPTYSAFINYRQLPGSSGRHWSAPKIWNDVYIDWCIGRIGKTDDFDLVLDTVTPNLYPDIQPNIFAKVMTFIFTPYSEGSRIANLATTKFAFGLMSRVMTGPGDDHEEVSRRFERQNEIEKDATLHYFFKIMNVKSALNCEVVKQTRTEIAVLKKDQKGIPTERIERWERFIDLIADYLECPAVAD